MSIKINALIPAAAAAADIPAPTVPPVAEPLLATLPVLEIYCSEITDGSGKFLMFVKIGTDIRAVTGTDGNVKLYGTAISVLKAAKAANLVAGGPLKFALYEKPASVGDPLEGLKARYKVACSKGFTAVSKAELVQAKISTAKQFGWDTSTGATLAEYQDLLARRVVLNEWQEQAIVLVESLADRLTTAGVAPGTVATAPQLPA